MRITAIASGVEYSIIHPYWLLDWDGLGMAPLHRLSERGPQQHGDTDLGYLLDPRFPTLVIGALSETPSYLWDLRAQLIGIFHPGRTVILEIEKDNGEIRRLDCVYFDGMNMPSQDRKLSRFQKVGVVLKAGDPTFYDPEGIAITFQLGGGGGAWVIPMAVPWTVGASVISQSTAIDYGGSAPAYPVIRIVGPITDPAITNETTGEVIDFTGVTIAGGDYYEIDLRYGSKTIVNSSGADKINDLTSDSDIATWHIAADPEASGGENSIRVEGSGVTETTKVEISFLNRYLGI